jgi:UDP-glucuronate 4-epimerase
VPLVCVTGGLGFVGSRLCALLARRGYEVVCVDRLSGRYSPGAGPDAARRLGATPGIRVAVRDLAGLDPYPLPNGADAVVHLAALPGVRSAHARETLWEQNVVLAGQVARAAAQNGTRMVLASSSSVYGNAACLPTPEHAAPAPLGSTRPARPRPRPPASRPVAMW